MIARLLLLSQPAIVALLLLSGAVSAWRHTVEELRAGRLRQAVVPNGVAVAMSWCGAAEVLAVARHVIV